MTGIAIGGAAPAVSAIEFWQLPRVGVGLGGLAYWESPCFANALYIDGRNWRDLSSDQTIPSDSTQLNAAGYPQYLEPGQVLVAAPGQHLGDGRDGLLIGRVTLTWRGNADVRLDDGDSIEGSTSGSEQDGRRVYMFQSNSTGLRVQIHAIDPSQPLTSVRLWLPDPANPAAQSLEPATGEREPIFHPTFLESLAPYRTLRCMDWGSTNGSPQRDWIDRRPPNHAFMIGVLNDRSPASTATGEPYTGNRKTGVCYEFMAALANESGKDLWINVPHLASNAYVFSLAHLMRFGSDASGVPYISPQLDPYWPPLAADRRLYIEYSNEIWAEDASFPQGGYAREQAALRGLPSRAEFNAERSCEIWKIFENVFGSPDRLVRVAAAWTSEDSGGAYTRAYLDHIESYGATLGVAADVMAVTSYFGFEIQNYIFDHQLYTDISEANLELAFDELERRLLSTHGSASGQDQVGSGGGFGMVNRQISLDHGLPLISYEGGPHITTNDIVAVLDGQIVPFGTPGAVDGELHWFGGDGAITDFVLAMNRHPRMAAIYRIHLSIASMLGLWMHEAFVDASKWGRYGQWGHLEWLGQSTDPAVSGYAVKKHFIDDWSAEHQLVRHIDNPLGTAPAFATEDDLPPVRIGESYDVSIDVVGGEGAIDYEFVGGSLPPGLTFDPLPSDDRQFRVSGVPSENGKWHFMLRVLDADGDPAYRIFSIIVIPLPTDLLFALDDFETTPLPRPLHQANTGFGFADAWSVQSGDPTGFHLAATDPLGFASLSGSSGGYAIGGDSWLTATRHLDIAAFDYIAQDEQTIGQNGTTLWISALARRAPGAQFEATFFLVDGDYAAVEQDRVIGVTVMPSGTWALQLRNADDTGFDEIDSGIDAEDGEAHLLVMRLDFAGSGDRARLYVDPPSLGGNPPATADGDFTTTGQTDIVFRTLGFYGSHSPWEAAVDDIRFGETYAAVTPTPFAPFLRADSNHDGAVNIADVVRTLVILLSGYPSPDCDDGLDANDDGVVDISDAVASLAYLFEAAPLAEPISACGSDPTADGLGCEQYSACP